MKRIFLLIGIFLCVSFYVMGSEIIFVMPLSTTADWMGESNQADAYYGYSVSSAGDVNGDGFSDVIIGALYYDNGETDEGAAFVYYGSGSGLSVVADWIGESNQDYTYYGNSVSSAGDVNGDGYSDVIVGARRYDNGETDEGAAFVYYGSATGLSTTADWMGESNQASASYGFSVSSAGDVNGDGYSDVIVGADDYDNGETDEGAAFVYYGSATGLSTTADWMGESNQGSANYGISVSSAGDVNGDGYSDVIIGAYRYDNGETDEGAAFVYYGSASGLSTTADWMGESDQSGASYGCSVSSAGDVNGDGFSDIIIGSFYYDNGESAEGAAFVYCGSSSGLSSSYAWMGESNQAYSKYGFNVSSAGDVNGDGYSDVIVGSYGYDNGETNEGTAFVYYGSASGLSSSYAWMGESDQSYSNYGYSVSSAGDVNGDGYSDVVIGALYYSNGESLEGAAFVYYGGNDGLSYGYAWQGESSQDSSQYGCSIASAGDINGDGYSDVIIGAYKYDNGEANEGAAFIYYGSASGLSTTADWMGEGNQAGAGYGCSVSSAGDVNGDGYGDIIIGAFTYTGDYGWGEGEAFVYYGSATGLADTADWVAVGNQGAAYYGRSVNCAGDVNGDGYSDIIVGSSKYDNGETDEGAAFVYYGSDTGLSTTADWMGESNEEYAYYGVNVSSAGDVNGDGYSDVIVGAYYYDGSGIDKGAAFVYYGSDTGLSVSADWMVESDEDSAYYGIGISSAGDVNGDGYSDIIVGAYKYDNGETNEGAAFVYYGSSSGLSTTADWIGESNQSNAYYGWSVSSAGDVNSDGYSDVIIGAYNYDNGETDEGAAFVYYGSPSGLSAAPDWMGESNQDSSFYGRSVSTAGDINGDGYSDIIVGLPYYDDTYTDEGAAFVYYGNKGTGINYKPQQLRADGTVPVIAPLYSMYDNRFMIRFLGWSFNGRDRVKLQWEVKPLGQTFDGTITGESSWFDTDTTGVEISEIINGLTNESIYKWRVRLKYDMVRGGVQPYSRWFYIDDNGPEEGDIRVGTNLWYENDKPNRPILREEESILKGIPTVVKLNNIGEIIKGKSVEIYDMTGRRIDIIRTTGQYFIVDKENKEDRIKISVIR